MLRIQTQAATRASGANTTTVQLTNVAVGALLVLTASVFNSGGTTATASGGGTWTQAVAMSAPGFPNDQIYIFYCPYADGGTTTVTFDPAGASASINLCLSEFAGHQAAPLDVVATNSGTVASNVGFHATVATGVLEQADTAVVAIVSQTGGNKSLTQDASWGFLGEDENNTTGQCYNSIVYLNVGSTAGITPNWDSGQAVDGGCTWFAACATFKTGADGVQFYPRPTWQSRMVGGYWEGTAGDPVTGPYTVVFRNPANVTPPDATWTWQWCDWRGTAFRYFRYRGANGTYCNVAEVQFWRNISGTLTRVTGTKFGSAGSFDANSSFDKALDDLTTTWFDSNNSDGGYTGLDTGAVAAAGKPHPYYAQLMT